MSNRKLFAMFALGTAFALTAALPAAAADREDKAPRVGHHEVAPASSVQAGFSTSGNAAGKISVQRQHSSRPSERPAFMEKSICSGTCGDITFICWGESTYCEDGGGCVAQGGDTTIILVCLAN